MALVENIITLEQLSAYKTAYDGVMAEAIATAEAESLHTVVLTGTTLKFYKELSTEITSETVPAFSISLPQQDLSNLMTKISGAQGGKIAQTTSAGLVEESTVAISDLETKAHAGTIPNGATATNIVDYAEEYADNKVAALDTVSDVTIASKSGNAVTIAAGVKEVDGIIAAGTGTDITLADVAATGAAEDVSYDNTTSGLTATDAQAALDELAAASAGGVASKTVYITETAGSSSDAFSKRYGIYQGSTGSSSSPVVGEKITDIDIPKDMVVEEGAVVTITYNTSDGKLYDGATDVTALIKGTGTATAADAGKYIRLTIANATSDKIYISVKDLVDIYTAQQNATQVQLAIDANNEISATIVAGSIGTTELASNAVTTAKITDANVTFAKLESTVQTSLGLADTSVQPADLTVATAEQIQALFA